MEHYQRVLNICEFTGNISQRLNYFEDYCKIINPTEGFYLKHRNESWIESDTFKSEVE
tara:strand:+ start:437 stop:610 length:174 start_codon:yes stop_codon:yes gene_type:complete